MGIIIIPYCIIGVVMRGLKWDKVGQVTSAAVNNIKVKTESGTE